ncbi:MAG: peptide chain release factor N(5)-glutamine methyltransferase [Terracidiphilus sp.]
MPPVSSFLLQGSTRLSFGPHPERARQDAELLLLHLLEKDRAWLLAHSNDEIAFDRWDSFYESLQRRCHGEPIQYILGETEFYGLPFRVTPDVLIPRPETEHLVEKAIELAARFNRPRIVDVGTGSGAIAIALAHTLPDAQITATDISPRALIVAKENARRNGVADRIRFLPGNLLDPVAGERFDRNDALFDIICSNPPYVAQAERASLAVEVREYEPAEALFAGEDGLDVIRRLIPQAFAALSPGGFIAMEIGHDQAHSVSALLAGAGFTQIEFTADLQGIPRVACAQRT